jgi:hypothetical protein
MSCATLRALFQANHQIHLTGSFSLNTVFCHLLDRGPTGIKQLLKKKKDPVLFVSAAGEMEKHTKRKKQSPLISSQANWLKW